MISSDRAEGPSCEVQALHAGNGETPAPFATGKEAATTLRAVSCCNLSRWTTTRTEAGESFTLETVPVPGCDSAPR